MATHKKQDNYNKDYITPIQVGASLIDVNLYQLKDNIGDNISDKNKVFCELTALYWIWKNSDYEYVGLCHYRRFFDIKDKEDIISKEETKKTINILESGKIIVPKIAYLGRSIERQYKHNHDNFIWDALINVLFEKYPDYKDIAEDVFKDNKMYPFNMFIAKKEFVNGYCEWLFNILFEVEKRVDIKNLNEYQLRYAGFLSERLFLIYLLKNNINLVEMNIVDENKKRVSQSAFKKIRNNLIYRLLNLK